MAADLTPFWRSVEALHDVVYFAPDAKERYGALGLKGGWMGYFVSRAASLGPVPPQVVTALFHGFAPTMVARAIPDGWGMAEREAVLDERLAIARDRLAPALGEHDIASLAERLGAIVDGLDLAGLPLAAAESALAVPDAADDAVGALWRRATVLRELRGDCHVAVLVGEGINGLDANVLQVATGRVEASQRENRGWSEEQWAAATLRLTRLGWLNDDGTASLSGRSTRDRIEVATDRACAALLDQEREELVEALIPDLVAAARSVVDADLMPYPNPTGAVRP